MALVVVRPGLFTTVQDRGRVGYRRFGVPVGGAFDSGAFDLANALLGNDPGAAALELTLLGGSFRAEADLAIALAGAPLTATVEPESGEARPWSIPQAGTLRRGETLSLLGSRLGVRAYLAVRGGWRTPVVLGSRSTETPSRAGDRFEADPGTTSTRHPSPEVARVFGLWDDPDPTIRWVDGPDFEPDQSELVGPYRVLDPSNRVGVRLEGASIPVEGDPSRLSKPVGPGAIQVAGGRPIILGVAGGTIGGYPHVGHVISADLDRVAQLRPGSEVRFERVTLPEARRVDADRRQARTLWRTRLSIWAKV